MSSYVFEKRATGADRARKRIHVPGEALEPVFTADGRVRVVAAKRSSLAPLRRKGFRLVTDPAPVVAKAPPPPPPPAPEPDPEPDPEPEAEPEKPPRQVELEAMSVRMLRTIARELEIKGRSSMDEATLVASILDAEA